MKKNFFRNVISSELIFSIWFWEFSLLKPVIETYKKQSFLILLSFTVFLFGLSIIKRVKFSKMLYLVIIPYLFFGIKFIFNFSEVLKTISYDFLTNSVLSVYFFSQVKNTKEILKNMMYIALVILIISFRDPFNNYKIFTDYMDFGFFVSLPVTLVIDIGRRYLNKKWLIFPECLSFILLCFYSNRSTILSFVFYYLLSIIFIESTNLKQILKILLFFIILLFIFINLEFLVKEIYQFSIENNLNIRILETLYNYFDSKRTLNSIDELSSGRIQIWKNAIDLINKNIFFGSGIGAFEEKYGCYSHNLFLDLMIQFGFFGTIFFVSLIIKSFWNIIHFKDYDKILGILFLSLWFPRLMLSSTLYSVGYLWLYLGFGLFGLKKFKILIKRRS